MLKINVLILLFKPAIYFYSVFVGLRYLKNNLVLVKKTDSPWVLFTVYHPSDEPWGLTKPLRITMEGGRGGE